MDNSEHQRKQKKMDAKIKKQNGKQKNFKKYFNCEYKPLIGGDIDEDVIIKIPPPPLHIYCIVGASKSRSEILKKEVSWLKEEG